MRCDVTARTRVCPDPRAGAPTGASSRLGSSLLFVASILIGGALAGRVGLVAGVAAAPLLAYPMVSWALHKHGAWTPKLDLVAFSGAAAGVLLLSALRGIVT